MRSVVAAIVASFLLAGCSGSSGDGGAGGPVCGDGIVSAPEVCDGPALGGKDCTTVPGGFVRGTLACAADCAAFDTAGCAGPACGDGTVSAPEVCDGADLGGKDCTTIPGGYVGGTLACAAGCLDFADARCALPPGPTCTYAGAICFRFEGAQGQALADLEAWCVKSTAAYAALGTCSTDGADPGYCEIPDLAFFGLSVPGVTARAYFYPPTIPASSATSTCEGIRGTWGGVGAWTCGDGVVAAQADRPGSSSNNAETRRWMPQRARTSPSSIAARAWTPTSSDSRSATRARSLEIESVSFTFAPRNQRALARRQLRQPPRLFPVVG